MYQATDFYKSINEKKSTLKNIYAYANLFRLNECVQKGIRNV